jgi:nicotinate-nucleotide adenylyltransferase
MIRLLHSIECYKDSELKVGLLGGSFNPAHEGHLYISATIKKLLSLDYVWWSISPRNPLKDPGIIAPLKERYKQTVDLTKNSPWICVTTIEKKLKTHYTIDTIKKLKQIFPKIKFVWIMGADNLMQFDQWQGWSEIFEQIPIVIYDRENYTSKALSSKAAIRFCNLRRSEKDVKKIFTDGRGWIYLHMRKHPISSTMIRRQYGEKIVSH